VTKNVGGNEIHGQARDGRRTGVAERAAEGEMVLSGHRRESYRRIARGVVVVSAGCRLHGVSAQILGRYESQ
jgi:hypothetical protein